MFKLSISIAQSPILIGYLYVNSILPLPSIATTILLTPGANLGHIKLKSLPNILYGASEIINCSELSVITSLLRILVIIVSSLSVSFLIDNVVLVSLANTVFK